MPTANGTYDFEFALFSALTNGTQLGTNQRVSGVMLNGETFNVQLDFGLMPFSAGAERYLEIRVKKPADTGYATLSPRQKITGTPYSIHSLSATTASNADTLDSLDSSSFIKTNTTAFIRNQTTQLESAGFNISGTGKANVFDAASHYNIAGNQVLSLSGLTNIFVGVSAGLSNTNGINNSFFGTSAGRNNTTGTDNVFFGGNAGVGNITGYDNSFVGAGAGARNTTGFRNSLVGRGVGLNNTSGNNNSFIGTESGFNNTTGNYNSFIGEESGFYNITGNNNSFFGAKAGYGNTSGSYNTFIGGGAGNINKSGSFNTAIGFSATIDGGNLSYATVIGGEAIVTTSNTIVLGRDNGLDKVRVFGLGAAGSTQLCRNADNEISTCTAQAALAENNVNDVNAATINSLREQVKQQQQQIDALIKFICSQNTKAEVCKQEK